MTEQKCETQNAKFITCQKLECKEERAYPPLSDDARKKSNKLIAFDQIKRVEIFIIINLVFSFDFVDKIY